MLSSSIDQVAKKLEKARVLYRAVLAFSPYELGRLSPMAKRHHREAIARLEAQQKTLTQELQQLQKEETL